MQDRTKVAIDQRFRNFRALIFARFSYRKLYYTAIALRLPLFAELLVHVPCLHCIHRWNCFIAGYGWFDDTRAYTSYYSDCRTGDWFIGRKLRRAWPANWNLLVTAVNL